jgi:hypothetical protein
LYLGRPASYFTSEVGQIWYILSKDFGIESYTFCQIQESRLNLAEQYLLEEDLEQIGSENDQNEWSDQNGVDDDDDDDDGDEEMLDLIESMD